MLTTEPTKPFNLDLNLDDPDECQAFQDLTKGLKLPEVMELLELRGKGAANLAHALVAYAHNKGLAIAARKAGTIKTALYRENICDILYKTRILPLCACW